MSNKTVCRRPDGEREEQEQGLTSEYRLAVKRSRMIYWFDSVSGLIEICVFGAMRSSWHDLGHENLENCMENKTN